MLNGYGDKRNPTISNHGVDIAAQRADDLDGMALDHLRSIKDQARALDVASASGGQAIRMALVGADVLDLDIDDYSEAFQPRRVLPAWNGDVGSCSRTSRNMTSLRSLGAST